MEKEPTLTTVCSKCGKKDERKLSSAASKTGSGTTDHVYKYWLPSGWERHNTEDGIGPEPEKVFLLCDECEDKFKMSVREFKP